MTSCAESMVCPDVLIYYPVAVALDVPSHSCLLPTQTPSDRGIEPQTRCPRAPPLCYRLPEGLGSGLQSVPGATAVGVAAVTSPEGPRAEGAGAGLRRSRWRRAPASWTLERGGTWGLRRDVS